jgi:stage II sporulation protein GA (sporulation sigma-E factor processing peptidase)
MGLQKVYIELVFLDNFIVNLLILLLASRLTKTPVRWRRVCMAAALGGIYGCVAVGLSGWPETVAVKIAAGFAMCFIAFFRRGEQGFWKNTCAFWASSFVLAGAVYACMISFGEPATIGGAFVVKAPVRIILLGLFVGAVLTNLLARVKRRALKREAQSADITLTLDDKRIIVKAFVDSGNLVRDPLSRLNVIFLSRASAKELLGKDLYELVSRRTPKPTKRLRIVPCATAAGQRLFYGIEIDDAALQGSPKGVKAVVCLSLQPLSGGFGAIAGTELLDELKRGATHENAVGTKTDRLGDAETEAGCESGLHQRERSAAAAADTNGGDDAAPAAGGGR